MMPKNLQLKQLEKSQNEDRVSNTFGQEFNKTNVNRFSKASDVKNNLVKKNLRKNTKSNIPTARDVRQ
jgi:hypothetical protein